MCIFQIRSCLKSGRKYSLFLLLNCVSVESIVSHPDERHCPRGSLLNVYFVVSMGLSVIVLTEPHIWFSFC